MRVRSVLVLGSGALLSCSLLTNLDDLSRAADAQADVVVADASGTDAPLVDGGACPAPFFCDDFDHGPLGARWSGVQTTSLGALAVNANAVSPPNALGATLSAGTPASDRKALLSEQFPALKAFDCTFEMWVDQTSTAERARFFSFYAGNPVWSGYELNVWIQSDGTSLLEEWGVYKDGGSFSHTKPFGPLAQKTWLHVEVLVDYTASVRVWVEGSPVAAIAMVSQSPTGETLDFGIRGGGVGAWSVSFDDLVCKPTL